MSTPVAVLGATGTVGQKMIALLEGHPDFHVAEVAASERSAGKVYGDFVDWREDLIDMPDTVKKLKIKPLKEVSTPYAISALPSDVAKEIEMFLAEKGTHVISNASAYRMDKNVPLVIPEINASHMELLDRQKTPGKIVTNSNCSTMFLALGLAPLMELGEIEHVSVVTLQAISGAGYPGVPSIDILGDIVPNIGGEEEKIESEGKKILGGIDTPADFSVTAHVHRVPVVHGHTIAMHIFYKNDVNPEDAYKAYEKANEVNPETYVIHRDEFSPRPRKHLKAADQRTHIGRIKQGDRKNILGLVALGHNLVRGAAGAAMLNLELTHRYMNK